MRISHLLLVAALTGESLASWGFGKSAYNKWHETELERWLSDNNIPYPKPADRKDLEKIVGENWQNYAVDSYKSWDAPQLQSYLEDVGHQVEQKRKNDKNWLVQQIKSGWHETEKSAETAYGGVRDWIFDSWTESQLKSFLDRHGIPNPTPRTRDTLLAQARRNYQTVADKLGETTAYPGNWLYESWSEADLKKWLDERGYPVPQPSSRDKLVAAVRRNSRLASIKAQKAQGQAKNTVSDSIFDSWSTSRLKQFLEENNVKIPRGSTKNELLALARRNKDYLKDTSDDLYSSVADAAGSATSAAGQKAADATDAASYQSQAAFDTVIQSWSDTRLKAYLDSRGVPVPQASKRDELLAKVRLNKHKAANGFGVWTFDTWTAENLKKWLEDRGQKVSNDAASSRDQLYNQATSYYNSIASAASASTAYATDAAGNAASKASNAANKATDAAGNAASQATDSAASAASAGTSAVNDASKQAYASVTSALAQATASVKETTFDTWSDSDLKAYLDTYGIKTYQGSTRNELIAMARRNAHYFRYGSADQGVFGLLNTRLRELRGGIQDWLGFGANKAQEAGANAGQAVYDTAKGASEGVYDSAASVGEKVQKSAESATKRVKSEL